MLLNLLGILSPAKDNFIAIEKALNGNPITNGQWKLFDVRYPPGIHKLSHSMGFKPLDVILMHVSEGGTVTFDHADFTDKTISFTVTSAETRFRFLVGKAS